MTTLRFSDGVEMDTDGPLRIEEHDDGLYVVGEGLLCAVATREEGEELIRKLRRRLNQPGGE